MNKSILLLSLFLVVGCSVQDPSTGGTTADNPEVNLGGDDAFDILYAAMPGGAELHLCQNVIYLKNQVAEVYNLPLSTPQDMVLSGVEFLATQTPLLSSRIVAASADLVRACGTVLLYSAALKKANGSWIYIASAFQMKWLQVSVDEGARTVSIEMPASFDPAAITNAAELEAALRD